MGRLPEDKFFLEIEKCIRPSRLYGVAYDPAVYIDALTSICDRLRLTDILASILVGHKIYHSTLNDVENHERYADYWKIDGRWSSIGVIESYMNQQFGLHVGIEDFCLLLERVGLILKTQADTKRVVKIQRKIESRFASYNEMEESSGKRHRANQEIFLHENSVCMSEFPLEELMKGDKMVAITNFHKNDSSAAIF